MTSHRESRDSSGDRCAGTTGGPSNKFQCGAGGDTIYWIHQIRLPDGTVTPGVSRPAMHDFGLDEVDVHNKRVLDIGCLDGLYTFYAEQRGAGEVVSIDILEEQFGPQRQRYNTAAGYLWAHKRLGSRAKYVFPYSVYDVSPDGFGQFDVVYCLGVIYHLAHPLLALERINDVMVPGGILVLESEVSATRAGFFHQRRHAATFPMVNVMSAREAARKLVKLLLRNPAMVRRLLPHIARRLANAIRPSALDKGVYYGDRTTLWVFDCTTLERLIDFSGFEIVKAFSHSTRMAYHCRKVTNIDATFAASWKYQKVKNRITNVEGQES